jgi:hypothetical protein
MLSRCPAVALGAKGEQRDEHGESADALYAEVDDDRGIHISIVDLMPPA